MRTVCSFLVFITLAAIAPPVMADARPAVSSADAARAAKLKEQGDAAMDALRYDDAIAAYTESYEIAHDPAVLYNRGRVHQARGEFPKALDDLERFNEQAEASLRARVPKLGELIAELRSRVATLDVNSTPPGARVLVRGVVVGTTPIRQLRLNAGPATLEVLADGYAPHRAEAVLAGGGSSAFDVVLTPMQSGPREAVLVVTAAGAPATVYVDDERVGTSPVEVSRPAGAHRIVLRREHAAEQEMSAVLDPGQRREIHFDAAPSGKALTSEWWFWTGVAAVAVGAGVTIFLVTRSDKAPSDGDGFQPGRVSAPLVAW